MIFFFLFFFFVLLISTLTNWIFIISVQFDLIKIDWNSRNTFLFVQRSFGATVGLIFWLFFLWINIFFCRETGSCFLFLIWIWLRCIYSLFAFQLGLLLSWSFIGWCNFIRADLCTFTNGGQEVAFFAGKRLHFIKFQMLNPKSWLWLYSYLTFSSLEYTNQAWKSFFMILLISQLVNFNSYFSITWSEH